MAATFVTDQAVSESDYDRLRRRVLWSMPSGLYILGTRADDRRNGMTLNWAMQVSTEPKQVAVGVLKTAFSHELLQVGRVFSLNILSRESRSMVRKFVKPVEVDVDSMTLNGFRFQDGLSGAPILLDAVAFLDCRVTQQLDTGDHSLFIGEVIDAGFIKEEVTEVLRMSDTRMNYGG